MIWEGLYNARRVSYDLRTRNDGRERTMDENVREAIDHADVEYVARVMRDRRDVVTQAFVRGNADAAWEMARVNRVVNVLQTYLDDRRV